MYFFQIKVWFKKASSSHFQNLSAPPFWSLIVVIMIKCNMYLQKTYYLKLLKYLHQHSLRTRFTMYVLLQKCSIARKASLWGRYSDLSLPINVAVIKKKSCLHMQSLSSFLPSRNSVQSNCSVRCSTEFNQVSRAKYLDAIIFKFKSI